jgi:hypothetical protein
MLNIHDALIELTLAEQAIRRVRDLHQPNYDNECSSCIRCLDYDTSDPIWEPYPCPTIKALDNLKEY